tara:strand:- start:562 stop:915 length:354 start_codon:yes stop_codon:yes gene_type:complete
MRSLYVLLILILFSCKYNDQKNFDRNIWFSSYHCKPLKQSRKRFAMVDDIRRKIEGKNKLEIESMLGKSLPNNVLANIKRDLLYCLGDKGFLMTMNWLKIDLDSNQIFKEVNIIKGD